MNMELASDTTKLLAHLAELRDKVEPGASVSALNSTANKIRQRSVNRAANELGIAAKILRKRIAVPRSEKATRKRPKTMLFGGLYPVRVDDLKPAPRELKSGRVKYKVPKGQSVNPNAFMAPHKQGSRVVFVRKGPSRLPIKRVTVEVGSVIKRSMRKEINSKASQEHYQKIFNAQMDRRIRGSLVRNGLTVK